MFRSPKEMFFQTLSAEICQNAFPYLLIGEVTLAGNSAVRRVLSTENRWKYGFIPERFLFITYTYI